MKPKNLIELIKAVKPRSAVFTTYTISIAFIEGVLLPTLRQVGCRDVDILVDANEAAASLEEVQSNSAGRKYRLVPVIAPGGGIFHPKLAYLVGQEFDILAVGSGNLTLPGQSKQLECLDVVRSDQHPGVFLDFSAMAHDLANKIAGTSKQAMNILRLVEDFSKAASDSSPNTASGFPDEPQLIHTVNVIASAQLIQLCKSHELQPTDLTVLSPFHAPDASPVLNLKKALGAAQLNVGLDRATLIAPFDKRKVKVAKDLNFVVPALKNDERHLHAKVFEISNRTSSIVMTGSINATAQSFNSTLNVEVSLARFLPIGSFDWEEVEPSKFEPRNFVPTRRDPEFAYLEANLGIDGKVNGQISGCDSLPNQAIANLVHADMDDSPVGLQVQIQPTGIFSFEVPFELVTTSAVQLQIEAPGLSAKCWLNIEEDLTSTDEERREKQAIKHILAGEFGAEDVFELLQILARATQVTTQQRAREKFTAVKPLKEMSAEESAQRFSYASWTASNVRTSRTGLLGLNGVSTLSAFLKWLNSSGTQTEAAEGTAKEHGVTSNKPAFKLVDASETPSQSYDFSESLRQIIQAIPLILSMNEKVEAASVLATISGAYALKMTLNSTWRDERAYKPLLSWLDEFSRFEYPEYGYQGLLKFALGAATTVVGIADQYGAYQPFAVLKDNLLRFNLRWSGRHPLQ